MKAMLYLLLASVAFGLGYPTHLLRDPHELDSWVNEF